MLALLGWNLLCGSQWPDYNRSLMNQLIERVLFVVAPPDSGKSTQLRSIFLDQRFGTKGAIPQSSDQRRLTSSYHISNERRLHLRLTSPHEYGDTPMEFIEKASTQMASGRWCFACPLQPDAHNNMPDVIETIRLFNEALSPERVRVCFLSPTRHSTILPDFLPERDLSEELLSSGVEVTCIDARHREANGLFLADFFDFT